MDREDTTSVQETLYYNDLTVVVPTYNEEKTINKLLEELHNFNLKVIIVDDGNDNLEEKIKDFYNISYVRGVGGESESVEHGIKYSKTKYVAVIDADGSHPISIIPTMLEEIKKNSNSIVVATRYENGGESNAQWLNKKLSKAGNLLINKFLGIKCSDTTGRSILAEKKLLLEHDVWYGRGDSAIALLYYLQKKNKANIIEVPFKFNLREEGEGSTSGLLNIIKYSTYYLTRILSLRLEKLQLFSDRYIQRGVSKDEKGEGVKVGYKAIAINVTLIPMYLILLFLMRIPLALFIAINWPQSLIGFSLRLAYYKTRLGTCEKDVLIDRNVNIWNPKTVYLGRKCIIDSGVTIKTSDDSSLVVGKESAIHQNTTINIKSGVSILYPKSCIGPNCAIYSHTNTSKRNEFDEYSSFSSATDRREQNIEGSKIQLGFSSYVGTGSTVVNSTIKDNSILGAGSFLKDKVIGSKYPEIWAGNPARKIKDRD